MADIRLLDKIKKLMDKADSAKSMGSLAEAEAFMSKVHELLIAHSLTMTQIEGHDIDDKSKLKITETGFEDESFFFGEYQVYGDWDVELLSTVAWNFMCDVLYRKRGRQIINKKGNVTYAGCATVVGTIENIEAVKFVFGYLRDIIFDMAKRTHMAEVNMWRLELRVQANSERDATNLICGKLLNHRHHNARNAGILIMMGNQIKNVDGFDNVWTIKHPENVKLMSYRETYIRSFLAGANRGMRRKYWESKKEDESNEQVHGIVLASEARLEAYKEENHTWKEAKRRKKEITDWEAYKKGVNSTEGLNMSKGVSTNRPKELRG